MVDKTTQRNAQVLLDRLERISADSPWAHQASGIRASLAKKLSKEDPDPDQIKDLLEQGYQILENAASEIPDEKNGIFLWLTLLDIAIIRKGRSRSSN